MEILIVRHAIAGERDARQWPDDRGRPLTPEGVARFRKVARHLGRVVARVDTVWASPLARAWQTAEILQREAGWPAPQELAALEPDAQPAGVVRFLAGRRGPSRVALVGHEPGLSELLSLLLAGGTGAVRLELKKGGAALVRATDGVRAGAAELLWLLPPRAVPGVDD
jgi:phosphohistidine phosphatase